MKIFITGGTGFVGSQIAQELITRGHEVVALVRRAGSLPGAGEIVGDMTQPETFLPEKLEGCEAAIHLVGIIREFPQRGHTFKQIHVAGTRNVLEACRRFGIRRILHMSALGKGYRSGALYQRTKAHAEDLVRNSGLDWTIFRPSTILGRGGEFLEMMRTFTRLGVAPLPGGGGFLLTPLAIGTVAQAYANALEREATVGKTYELGGDMVSYRQLLEKVATKTGTRPRYVNVPLGPLYVLAALLDTFPFFPITQEQITMLQETVFPNGDSAYRELGLEYKGIERVLEEALGIH
jgi:NADH dehydrogenase